MKNRFGMLVERPIHHRTQPARRLEPDIAHNPDDRKCEPAGFIGKEQQFPDRIDRTKSPAREKRGDERRGSRSEAVGRRKEPPL